MNATPARSGPSAATSVGSELQKLPFFAQIGHGPIAHLKDRGTTVSVEAGQLVFRAGEPADCMAVVLSGQMRISVPDERGVASTLAHLGPGEFVVEMAMLEGGRRWAALEATEAGELLTLDRRGFLELLGASQESLAALLRYLRGGVDLAVFESELATQKLRLEMEAERYRSLAQIVAGVAHEVNTPLGIINTASTIIQRELGESTFADLRATRTGKAALETVLEASDLIQRNIKRAHTLIQSFKSISASQLSDTRESIRLRGALEEIVYLFGPNARKAKLQIELQTDLHDQEATWVGYRGHLSRVILNLLTNVERYAYPEGKGGRVEIRLGAAATAASPCFQVTVRDFGKGIAPENLPRIFDPFFTTGRATGGTGLGMAIVHNLVTAGLRGTISIESQPEEGTLVRVLFPREIPA
jgi:signal transduction histidine kinase